MREYEWETWNEEEEEYPRILRDRESDKWVTIDRCTDVFEVHVVRELVLEEEPDHYGYYETDLRKLAYYQPCMFMEELMRSGDVTAVTVVYEDGIGERVTVPKMYVPAEWGTEEIKRFVRTIYDMRDKLNSY